MEDKFKPGDKVRIINYGHAYLCRRDQMTQTEIDNIINGPFPSETNGFCVVDAAPWLVGKEFIVSNEDDGQYGLYDPHNDSYFSWYDSEQLELVSKNKNIE